MTEEEFLKRWIMHYIHPEYFYIPFGDYMKLIEKIAYKNGVYLPKDEIDPETGKKYSPPAQGYSKFTVALPLDSKEVQITTSGIEESQAGIFTYNPHDENPELEGYSLFTIDLSGVKDDIEDLQQRISDAEACRQQVIAALQRYDPTYDPAEGECPSDKVNDVVDDVEDLQEQVDDLTEQVEECDQCKADVIAKLQEYDPDFDPQICSDIPPEIDEIAGYKFPEDTPYEDIMKIVGMDTVEIEGNDYYFDVRAVGTYSSFNPSAYPRIDIEENAFYVATTPANYDYGGLGWYISVYNASTGEYVTGMQFGPIQGFDAGEYVKLISLSINYTTKTMDGVYETDDPYPHTPVQIAISANLASYITTTSPNPQYKVRNS